MTAGITDEQLDAYRLGRLDAESDAAVEEMLMTNPSARTRLNALASQPRLDDLWFDISNEIDRPRPARLERIATRLGASEAAGRLAGATPSLTRAWIGALCALAVLSLIVSSDAAEGQGRFIGFLVIAPLMLIGAVALAYRRSAEPAHEIAIAAPVGGLRLLLWRVAAVAPVAILVNVGVGIILRGGWFSIAWLLPGVALTFAALALSATYSMVKSTTIVGVAWILLMSIVVSAATDNLIAFRLPAQLFWAIAASVGAWVLWHRKEHLEQAVRW